MVLLALGREQEMKSVQADVKLYSFANVTHTKERMENQELINDDNSMEVPRLVLFSDKPWLVLFLPDFLSVLLWPLPTQPKKAFNERSTKLTNKL